MHKSYYFFFIHRMQLQVLSHQKEKIKPMITQSMRFKTGEIRLSQKIKEFKELKIKLANATEVDFSKTDRGNGPEDDAFFCLLPRLVLSLSLGSFACIRWPFSPFQRYREAKGWMIPCRGFQCFGLLHGASLKSFILPDGEKVGNLALQL